MPGEDAGISVIPASPLGLDPVIGGRIRAITLDCTPFHWRMMARDRGSIGGICPVRTAVLWSGRRALELRRAAHGRWAYEGGSDDV